MGQMLLVQDEMNRLCGNQPSAPDNIFEALMTENLKQLARQVPRAVPDKKVVKRRRGPDARFM